MVRLKYIFLGLLSVFIIHLISVESSDFNISGKVQDEKGNSISGADVILKRKECRFGYQKESDINGKFSFSIADGCLKQSSLEVTKDGYKSEREVLTDNKSNNKVIFSLEKSSYTEQSIKKADKEANQTETHDVSSKFSPTVSTHDVKPSPEKTVDQKTTPKPKEGTSSEKSMIDSAILYMELMTVNELFKLIGIMFLFVIPVLIVSIGFKMKILETNMTEQTEQITKIADNMNNAEKSEKLQPDISAPISDLMSAINSLKDIAKNIINFEKNIDQTITQKLNEYKQEIIDGVINEIQKIKIPVNLTQPPPSSGYVESQSFSSHISVSPLQKEKAEYKKFLEQGPSTIASKFCYLGSARKDPYNPRFLFSEENSISQCHYILFYKNSNEKGWIFPNLKDFSIAMRTLFPGLNYDTSSENITPVLAHKISSGEWVASTP